MASCKPGTPWCPSGGPNYSVTPATVTPDVQKRQLAPKTMVGTTKVLSVPKRAPMFQGGVWVPRTSPAKRVTLSSAPTPSARFVPAPKVAAAPVVVSTQSAPHVPMRPNGQAFQPPAPSREPAVPVAAVKGMINQRCVYYAIAGAFLAYLVRK